MTDTSSVHTVSEGSWRSQAWEGLSAACPGVMPWLMVRHNSIKELKLSPRPQQGRGRPEGLQPPGRVCTSSCQRLDEKQPLMGSNVFCMERMSVGMSPRFKLYDKHGIDEEVTSRVRMLRTSISLHKGTFQTGRESASEQVVIPVLVPAPHPVSLRPASAVAHSLDNSYHKHAYFTDRQLDLLMPHWNCIPGSLQLLARESPPTTGRLPAC